MISRLPTAEEINVFDSLDERSAVEHFLGKDLEQAQALFCENFLYYQEDLMWMGPKAFRFYLPAALSYLHGTEADGDSDAASSSCGVIEFRLEDEPALIAALAPVLRAGILGILDHFERYECDHEIYGDVTARYHALLSRMGG